MNNDVYIPLFEYGSYIVCVLIGILLFTRYKHQRIYQWIYFASMLTFPSEWFGDNYFLYLNYDQGFNSMFGHFPLFLPFAWAWFFPFIIVVLINLEKSLAKLPKPLSVLVIYLLCFLWDLIVEALACKVGIWVYWWPEDYFIPFTELPVWIPVFTGLFSMFFYFVASWGRKQLSDDSNLSWIQGFASIYWRFVLIAIVISTIGFFFINYIVGHDPTPWAPEWWVKSGILVF